MQDENKDQDSKPRIQPSEPKDENGENEKSAGDPGRTPGKAEGEDTDEPDVREN